MGGSRVASPVSTGTSEPDFLALVFAVSLGPHFSPVSQAVMCVLSAMMGSTCHLGTSQAIVTPIADGQLAQERSEMMSVPRSAKKERKEREKEGEVLLF